MGYMGPLYNTPQAIFYLLKGEYKVWAHSGIRLMRCASRGRHQSQATSGLGFSGFEVLGVVFDSLGCVRALGL